MKLTPEEFAKQYSEDDWKSVGLRFESMFIFSDEDQIFEGHYLGSLEPRSEKDSMIHVFNDSVQNVGIWGSALLDDLLSAVPVNSDVVIAYFGTKATKKGNNTYKVFDLKVKKD